MGGSLAINDAQYYSKKSSPGVLVTSDVPAFFYWSDESGNPLSEEASNRFAKIVPINEKEARILGYREEGNLYLGAVSKYLSPSGETLLATPLPLSFGEILPDKMNISLNGKAVSKGSLSYPVGSTLYFSGDFSSSSNPNVTNRKIHLASFSEEAFLLSGDKTESLRLTLKKEGSYSLIFESLANPSLKAKLTLEVTVKPPSIRATPPFRSS